MTENPRSEASKANDDSELIDAAEDAPTGAGASGGNLQRDVGTRSEEKAEQGNLGVERVRDSDKEEGANLPRCNDS